LRKVAIYPRRRRGYCFVRDKHRFFSSGHRAKPYTSTGGGWEKSILQAGKYDALFESAFMLDPDSETYKLADQIFAGIVEGSDANIGDLFVSYIRDGGSADILAPDENDVISDSSTGSNLVDDMVDNWNGVSGDSETLAGQANTGYNGIAGAGNSLDFKYWDDFSDYIQAVGKETTLTIGEKVSKIQNAYIGVADKTDINIPIDAMYVKGFTADGKVEYDWPKYLGFDITTITSISRNNLLPETWDRYGSMNGSNFADVPSGGSYSYSERSTPYVENENAYHSGSFNNDTYFDKIDAIRTGNLGTLNDILESEGILELDTSEFENLYEDYAYFIAKIAKEIGTYVDATYGIKGTAAAWGDLKGGAGQIITPLIRNLP